MLSARVASTCEFRPCTVLILFVHVVSNCINILHCLSRLHVFLSNFCSLCPVARPFSSLLGNAQFFFVLVVVSGSNRSFHSHTVCCFVILWYLLGFPLSFSLFSVCAPEVQRCCNKLFFAVRTFDKSECRSVYGVLPSFLMANILPRYVLFSAVPRFSATHKRL